MTNDEFDYILGNRVDKIRKTLSVKAKEYALGDQLYNFKRSATMLNTTPRKALWCIAMKHLVSVIDLVNEDLNDSYADEKIGDMINYLILLEAIIKEESNLDEEPLEK